MTRETIIKVIALDVDGVLTDGHIIYTSDDKEIKAFHAQDGLAMSAWKACGKKLAIITGRHSPMVERRAGELKVDFLRMGRGRKTDALRELCAELGVRPEEVAYMGDDLNDLAIMEAVGLPMAPANARPEVRARAFLVTAAAGGSGAVREAVEYICQKQNLWQEVLAMYGHEEYAGKQ